MSTAATKHVENHGEGLGTYDLYKFEIHLMDGTNIDFECPAMQCSEAWVLVAMQASRYNMTCMTCTSIVYKGKE